MAIQEMHNEEVEQVAGGATNIVLQNVLTAVATGATVLLTEVGQATGLTPVTTGVSGLLNGLLSGLNSLVTGVGTALPIKL